MGAAGRAPPPGPSRAAAAASASLPARSRRSTPRDGDRRHLLGRRSAALATAARRSTPPSSIKTSPVTIGLNSSTTYTQMESTAASSLAVGDCVAAIGSTDSTGAVTAQSVRITSTGGQSCTGGFPGGGGPAVAPSEAAVLATGGSNG